MFIKMFIFRFLIIFAFVFYIQATEIQNKRIVCYYTFPSSISDLRPNQIDPNLCTHVLVGFASIQNSRLSISRNSTRMLKDVVALKVHNPEMKVLLSIGGGGTDAGFPDMIKEPKNRSSFINSLDFYIKKTKIDGVDLDWEFPSEFLLKNHFTTLLQEMRNHISNSVNPYILSVAVAAPITIVSLSYDIPEINRYVDFINIMSYDYFFYSPLTPWTAMNAPLYKRSADVLYFATQNINYTANFWLENGADKEKINIGLPVYAHTYSLKSPNENYLGAPAVDNGKLGGGGGSVNTGEVCDFMKKFSLKTIFDEETKSPYVTHGTEWISFENLESITFKANFVRDNRFGGVMVYSLSVDDYKGTCSLNKEKFPLVKLIKKIMSNKSIKI